ncbi:MAG: hypothetical protein ACI3XE_03400 [Eubacteriales bacterium]
MDFAADYHSKPRRIATASHTADTMGDYHNGLPQRKTIVDSAADYHSKP